MTEKVLGYVLIFLGIASIVYSSMSVYEVFTKKAQPAVLFTFPGISMDPAQLLGGNLPPGVTFPAGAKIDIMTPDMINTSSNIFAHIVLMGFLASAGLKLATIGTQLVRTIEVKVHQESTHGS